MGGSVRTRSSSGARARLLALGLATGGGLLGFELKSVLADGIPTENPLYYSGTLTENGQLVDGQRTIGVNVFADQAATTPICPSFAAPVSVTSGRFRVALDSSCKAAINKNNNAWVEVLDGAVTLGRAKIGAVPYAVEADHAINATNAATAAGAATVTKSLSSAMFRVSASCSATIGNNPHLIDCMCNAGEIAVTGGGFCGSSGNLVESAHIFRGSNAARDLSGWRVQCSAGPPENYYVLCVAAP
jgi:hypothetical protein